MSASASLRCGKVLVCLPITIPEVTEEMKSRNIRTLIQSAPYLVEFKLMKIEQNIIV